MARNHTDKNLGNPACRTSGQILDGAQSTAALLLQVLESLGLHDGVYTVEARGNGGGEVKETKEQQLAI